MINETQDHLLVEESGLYLEVKPLIELLLSNEDFTPVLNKFFHALKFLINLGEFNYPETFKKFLEKVSLAYIINCLTNSEFRRELIKNQSTYKDDLNLLLMRADQITNNENFSSKLQLMYSHLSNLYKIKNGNEFFGTKRIKNVREIFVSFYNGVTAYRLSTENPMETFAYSSIFVMLTFVENWVSYSAKSITSKFEYYYFLISAGLASLFYVFNVASFSSEEDWVSIVSSVSLSLFAIFAILGRKYMNSSAEIVFLDSTLKIPVSNILNKSLRDWPNMKAFVVNSSLRNDFLRIEERENNFSLTNKGILNQFRRELAEYNQIYEKTKRQYSIHSKHFKEVAETIQVSTNKCVAYLDNKTEEVRGLIEAINQIKSNDSKEESSLEQYKKNLEKEINSCFGETSEAMNNLIKILREIAKVFNSELNNLETGFDQLNSVGSRVLSVLFPGGSVDEVQFQDSIVDLGTAMVNMKILCEKCENFSNQMVIKNSDLNKGKAKVDEANQIFSDVKQDMNLKIEAFKLQIAEKTKINPNMLFGQTSSSVAQGREMYGLEPVSSSFSPV